jgi:hypothetical protein
MKEWEAIAGMLSDKDLRSSNNRKQLRKNEKECRSGTLTGIKEPTHQSRCMGLLQCSLVAPHCEGSMRSVKRQTLFAPMSTREGVQWPHLHGSRVVIVNYEHPKIPRTLSHRSRYGIAIATLGSVRPSMDGKASSGGLRTVIRRYRYGAGLCFIPETLYVDSTWAIGPGCFVCIHPLATLGNMLDG